jgi:hypothetical protein
MPKQRERRLSDTELPDWLADTDHHATIECDDATGMTVSWYYAAPQRDLRAWREALVRRRRERPS